LEERRRIVLFRFALYGFLRNQRYFEPFWVLAFLDKGLSYAVIGALIGFRAACVAVLEIPTGAVADVIGRRWAMICSHVAYVAAFVTFGYADSATVLFLAMFAFGIGEAFRTGTHKAMIFDWLARQGREKEKTHVYGFTRSWSQIGAAVSVVVAAMFVFALREYSVIFWISVAPAALNIVNFLTYPKYLDGSRERPRGPRNVVATLRKAMGWSIKRRSIRRAISESCGFEGMYKASKDYLQPIVQQAVLAMPVLLVASDTQRTAVAIGAVYAVLYLLGGAASRNAGRLSARVGGENRASLLLWLAFFAAFGLLFVGIVTNVASLGIVGFLALTVLQNLWRPIIISRIADEAPSDAMATVLSIESQAKSLGTAVLAPLLGIAIGAMPPEYRFVPVAVLGMGIAVVSIGTKPKATSHGPRHEFIDPSDGIT
jgi:MFS family permease